MIDLSGFLKGVSKLGWIAVLALLVIALSACAALGGGNQPTATPPLPTAVGGGAVQELPTPLPAEEVGTGASSGALDTPEGTWGNYLRDMIAEQNQIQASQINLLERYQDPGITQQNLAGTLKEITLVADRSEIQLIKNDTVATVKWDFDVRLTYANGDSDTRTCTNRTTEIDKIDSTWYVLSPAPLAVFSYCN